jgi:predicted metal-dependent hydrolase
MENTFLITKENLLGSLATAILQLKKLKEKKNESRNIQFFSSLIDFIDKANTDNYRELLYDKNFIVSEETLGNIHDELNKKEIDKEIDLKELKTTLLQITNESNSQVIEKTMDKLKEIAEILWQMNNNKQSFM